MTRTSIVVAALLTGGACANDDSSSVSMTTVTAPAAASAQLAYKIIPDILYVESVTDQADSQQLDVYAPTSAGSHPVAVLLHGGGATRSHADVVAVSGRLAEAGLVVFVPTHAATGSPSALTAAGGRLMRESFEDTLCAIRYAGQHAAAYGGDATRVVVIGHSAGGFLGMIAALGGDGVEDALNDSGQASGTPPQLRCVSTANVPSISGFVGYNGAYFVFLMSGLSDCDPELWALANPRTYVTPGTARMRMILGGNDSQTPAWHIDEVTLFAEELRGSGYDAELVRIDEAGHGWTTAGPVWDTTLETILAVTGSS